MKPNTYRVDGYDDIGQLQRVQCSWVSPAVKSMEEPPRLLEDPTFTRRSHEHAFAVSVPAGEGTVRFCDLNAGRVRPGRDY